ncbi:MAG: M48 family metalloprotease [Archangium sp.]|nr:M48 family metalloprotease [Archangium sp.]
MNTKRTLIVAAVAIALFATCTGFRQSLKDFDKKTGLKTADNLNPYAQVANGRYCEKMETEQVTWEEEHSIGGVIALGLGQKSGGFMVDPLTGPDGGTPRPLTAPKDGLNTLLSQVGLTVAAYSARPDIPWTFGVLESSAVNAYSAPGGYVFVTAGLLKRVENESQLAGVLAHEIGHVTHRHALRAYMSAKAAQCLAKAINKQSFGNTDPNVRTTKLAVLDIGGLVGNAITSLVDPVIDSIVTKGFAQDDEYEADQAATDMLVMAGYNPLEYQKLIASLPTSGAVWPNHPPPAERASRITKHLTMEWKDSAFEKAPAVPLDARLDVARK